MPSPIFPSNPQSHQASNAMKRILPALFALLGPALAALAADNEIQVKASGTAPQNSFALKKTVTADAQKLAVRKYLLKQNAELDDRIVDEALSEYTKFIEDWEELDASWEALDSTQGQLTVEGMATIDLEEANEWLEARGVNRQGSIQIVVMEEPPSLGSMKFDEAFGTGIDGAKFFLQNYTLFQRKIRDALVKKVGTLGFDVQLLEDRPVYKKFLTADGTLVGVRFDPDANQFVVDRDLLDAVRAQQPDTLVLYYRVDTLAFDPKTREMRSSVALSFKNLGNGVTKALDPSTFAMKTAQTQKDLILDDFATCATMAINKLMNANDAAERLNHLALSVRNAPSVGSGPMKLVFNATGVDAKIRKRALFQIKKQLESGGLCAKGDVKTTDTTLLATISADDIDGLEDLYFGHLDEIFTGIGLEISDDQVDYDNAANTLTVSPSAE